MEATSPRDQWADELEHLWSVEQELRDALPGSGAGPDEELKRILKTHQARTEEHLARLREIFVAGTQADRVVHDPPPAQSLRRPTRRSRKQLSAGA